MLGQKGDKLGCYVVMRLVQQKKTRVQELKRYSVGGWNHRRPRRACGWPIRLCLQRAASIVIGSSAEEKPSHLQ